MIDEDNRQERTNKFLKIIGVETKNLELFETALTHRSFINETRLEKIEHNERLEFLGDAVLELIITEYLFHKYPEKFEGELTSFRAATVRTESLAETAEKLGIGDFLFVSKGEEMTGGRKKPYILANTYESLLGAIYLDQGYETSKEFVYSNLTEKIDEIVKNRLDIDSKSKLQEISQEILNITPRYELINTVGPDHNRSFTMRVLINEWDFGQGVGKNKQEAEQRAAKKALEDWDTLIEKMQQH